MSQQLGYIKSFDGMRGFFALLIIMTHWPLDMPISPIGWEGLQLFFVLSGFLITRILLNERAKPIYQNEVSFGGFMKKFMTKRAFRIFPLYFAYIILMYLVRFGMSDSKFFSGQTAELEVNGIWLWTYLYNFKDFFNHLLGWEMVETPFFAHLWSLSLEEQFYVFFPFIVFFVRGKALKITIVAMIIIPIITRIIGYPYLEGIAEANNYREQWAILNIYRNIFFQFDSLAIGAAAAIFDVQKIKNPRAWLFAIVAILFSAYAFNCYSLTQIADPSVKMLPKMYHDGESLNVLGYIFWMGYPEILKNNYQYAYMFTLINFTAFFMLVCSVQGNSVLKFIFENKVFVYLGKISYGTYVFHFAFMQFFFFVIKKYAFIPPLGHFLWLQVVYFIVYILILYFIAHLSFKYFEMYFLNMKSKKG
jgi:peptidoglycan/LPS O-acetylase OafA/YrhL